jgi:acyl-CoA thioester hydrolase
MAGIKTFSLPIRIYFEDTDSGGVVYHSNYLKFMERARTEWLRSIGIDQRHLKQDNHIMFVVHRIDIQFKLPARFNDDLIVKSELKDIGSSKIEFRQMIYRSEQMSILHALIVKNLNPFESHPPLNKQWSPYECSE